MTIRFLHVAVAAALLGFIHGQPIHSKPPAEEIKGSEETPEVVDVVPEVAKDRAFDRFIAAAELQDTILSGDAEALADAALLLAEGERVLHRSHKAIKAATVFNMAVRAAAKTGDKATLERLAKAAGPMEKPLVEAALKLAGASRATLPSLEGLPQETADRVREFTQAITVADRLRNRAELLALQKRLPGEKYPKPVTDHLAGELKTALAIAPAKPDTEGDLLQKLAGVSRMKRLTGTPVRWRINIRHFARTGTIAFTLGGIRRYLRPGTQVTYTGTTLVPLTIYFQKQGSTYRNYVLTNGRGYVFRTTSAGVDLYNAVSK